MIASDNGNKIYTYICIDIDILGNHLCARDTEANSDPLGLSSRLYELEKKREGGGNPKGAVSAFF